MATFSLVAADWAVAENGAITYTGTDHGTGTPSYARVIEFHRWLQDLADDAVATPSTNDILDITDSTPSDRATDNLITLNAPYFIDDNAAQHLYDGSIVQNGGDDIYDGIVNFGNTTFINLLQDGALVADQFWNEDQNGETADTFNEDAGQGISHRFLVKVRSDGADIDGRRLLGMSREYENTYSEFNINGTARGNNVLALSQADDLNNETVSGTVATWTTITNVTAGYNGIDVDGNTVNEFYYSEWNKDTYSINQFYERMKYLTRRGETSALYGVDGELFRGITHEIAYDGASGSLTEGNRLVWGTTFDYDTELAGGLTVGEYYTFGTGGAVGKLVALDDDGANGSCVFAMETGQVGYTAPVNTETFVRSDGTATDGASVASVPVGTTDLGGEGALLADDASATVWIQLLSGSAPTNDMVLYEASTAGVYDADAGPTVTVNATITPRPISQPFIGQSTGSAIIGAYGIGIEAPTDVTDADKLTDLSGTVNTPPNNVTFTVSGLISGEYRVFVGPRTAGVLDTNQRTLSTSLTTDLDGLGDWSLVVVGTEPPCTPATGTIRVVDDNGVHRPLIYTSVTGASPHTYTIDDSATSAAYGTEIQDFSGVNATAGVDVYLAYVDELASGTTATFTAVYDSDLDLFVRVRDGGASPIKTFESVTSTLTSTGGGVGAIRTSDE